MGYTHYFTQHRDLTDAQWDEFCEGMRRIVEYPVIMPILSRLGENFACPPDISDEVVSLNGVGDQMYETFLVKKNGRGFDFCKTNNKPYDRVVVAALVFLETTGAFDITSDGYAGDWADGLHLAKEVGWPNRDDLVVPLGIDRIT